MTDAPVTDGPVAVRVRPHRPKPKSVLILGSGPVVIGQAAEFDYAGTQACRALRDEGVRTILLNSNPATIMTDPGVADVVYLEPLTVESVERILAREQPDGILAGLGGQTALNLRRRSREAACSSATKSGCWARRSRRSRWPRTARRSAPCSTASASRTRRRTSSRARRGRAPGVGRDAALAEIGLPAVIRPAFTLGGTGGGIVQTEDGVPRARSLRPAGEPHRARSWSSAASSAGRRSSTRSCATPTDTCIAVCSMENVDPLGVHTGDSIVVAPVQTLPDQAHQRLRSAALAIIRALGVEGGCNVQFALSPGLDASTP